MRFSWLEKQVTYIKHNVNLLNKLRIFGEDGGLNAKEKLDGGSRDREDTENQPKKEPKKYQLSSSVVNQSLFK